MHASAMSLFSIEIIASRGWVGYLEFLRHVGVGSPVAKVIEAFPGAGEHPRLDHPDADHRAGSAFAA